MSRKARDKYSALCELFGIGHRRNEHVDPHQFPIAQQERMWEPKFDWSFSHEQVQYHGVHAIYAASRKRKTI